MDEPKRPTPPSPAGGDASDPEVTVDRRRPGRVEHTNPHLIALLRGSTGLSPEPGAEAAGAGEALARDEDDDDISDPLAPARGIMFGLLLAAPFWAVIAVLWWWWFHV